MAILEVSGIYKIENVERGIVYIGQSKDVFARFNSHKSELRKNRHHNRHLQAAWNKYGEDAFKFSLVEECSTELLDEREVYWISTLGTYGGGYNLDLGGKGGRGYKYTEEQREKRSELFKGRALSEEAKSHMRKPHVNMRGANHPLFGTKWAERLSVEEQAEVRQKISAKLSGENNPMYGKKVSRATAKKISDSNKRYYEIFGSPLKGRKFPERCGKNSPQSVSVICVNTGEIFNSMTEAAKKYPQSGNISRCCAGKISYSGKDTNGTKLVWRYLSDYVKESEGGA